MFISQHVVHRGVFQSRGFAFRIIGRSSGCPDTDDVGRQFIAEAVQGLTLTELRKLHSDPSRGLALIEEATGCFTLDFRLLAVRHAVWRNLNRSRTRMKRFLEAYLPEFAGGGA